MLYQEAYPICIEDCMKQGDAQNKDYKVFSQQQLECSTNCLNKYKSSLNLAMGLLTLTD